MKKLMFVFFLLAMLVMTGCGEVKSINLNGTEVARVDGENLNIQTDKLATPSLQQSQNPPDTCVDATGLVNCKFLDGKWVVNEKQLEPTMPVTVAIDQHDFTWSDFQNLQNQAANDTYALISMLDTRKEKENHPQSGWTATTTTDILVVWTGSYINDPTYGNKVEPLLVDGKTGVWLQKPGTTVIWQTPGGSLRIFDYKGADDNLNSCVNAAEILEAINSNKNADSNKIYIKLDEIANKNVSAKLRTEGPATYTVKNTKALFWVRSDQIKGQVLEIDRTEGKSLYLVTADGTVNLTFAHSGLRLCNELNPVKDFPWWK